MNRVAVTGLGVVSPVGLTAGDYWSALVEGRSGLAPPQIERGETLNTKLVGQVRDFHSAAHFDAKQLPLLDRVSQFAVVAAREAIAQSGLTLDDELSERTASIVGSGSGGQGTQDDGFHRLYAEHATRLHPLSIPRLMLSAPASQVSIHCNARGPSYAVASACASSTHAIGQAFHLVRSGMVTCALAGGAEAGISFGALKGWEAMRIMAPDACRPFSRDRKGMVIAEGAAILMLENLDHAKKRGANILAEIAGFGMSADARDLTAPDSSGMARAITMAMNEAKLAPADVHYVNAHGTGTVANDEAETHALHKTFGGAAKKLAISSTKSVVGHSLGAAGALEKTES